MKRLSPARLWSGLGTARFRANFRVVALANIGSQALLLLASPILSRLFEPADFGVLALYVSVTSLVVSMATLRFDWLMPNARSDRSAAALFVAGGAVLGCVTLAVGVVVLVAGETVLPERYAVLQSFAPLIPLGILGLGLHQLYQGWYVRRSDLLPVSKTKIVQSVGNIAISITLGLLAFGALGLLFATLVASWLGISMLVRGAPDLGRHLRGLRRRQIVAVARRFTRQAVLSTAVSGLNVASSQAIILLLALVYAPAQVGLVAFAHRLMAAPVTIVAQALSQSFWAHTSDLVQARDYRGLRRDYLKVTYLLLGLAATLGLVALAAQPLIVPVFGPDWTELGAIVLALVPLIWGAAVVSPTNHLVVLNRQGLQLYADILRLGLVGSAIVAAAFFDWDFVWAVLAVACSSLLGHMVLFFVQLNLHGRLIAQADGAGR